jgi:hypothetical protein
MRFRYVFLAAALVVSEAHAIQLTCSQAGGDKQLTRVSPESIEVRSGSGARSIPLAQIASIEVTGPVNRANRYAWADVKSTSGDVQKLGLVLPNAGALMLEGTDGEGKAESIDVLDCRHVDFKAS